jgi:amino acid adenylation domain-containing protein
LANRDVEDIYPLTPMQAGMLFHSLYSPQGGEYVTQTCFRLEPTVDAAVLEQCWRLVINHYPALRSSVEWRDLEQPLQLVHRQVCIELEHRRRERDDPAEGAAWIDAFLAEDRRRGINLAEAPLMRLTLLDDADGARRLVWTHHHILFDGWSLPLLLEELRGCYRSLVAGEDPSLPETEPFRNFIAWLGRRDAAADEAWWRRQLHGLKQTTSLFAGLTPHVLSTSGAAQREGFELSAPVTERLRDIARTHHMTLNTIVQGTWAVLLSRYSGSSDVVFGITVSGRPAELPGVESMIGLFINTVPLRAQVPPGASLLPWLQQLQSDQTKLRGHEHAALTDVQRWSELPAGTPLFETLLVFENYPDHVGSTAESAGLVLERAVGQTNLPLTLVVLPEEQLAIHLHYDAARFSREAMIRLSGHIRLLLETIVARPDVRLGDLELLTEPELHRQVVEWNATEVNYPRDTCLHQLVAEQALRTPDSVVSDGRSRLSFAELDDRAGRLASRLRELGAGPDELVGVCMERSTDLVVALLGILKSGAAFLPLEPDQPRQRLALMLSEARPRVVLTTTKDHHALPPSAPILRLDSERDSWMSCPPTVATDCGPDNLAYVLFTSGSTGVPKGVMVEHRSLVNQLLWLCDSFRLTSADHLLQKTPLGFDPALWELFCPLLTGASLTLVAPGAHADPQRLVDAVRDEGITVLGFVPSMLEEFMDVAIPGAVGSLRLVTSGGEVTTPALVHSFFDRFGADVELRNMYGPTEAVITASWWRCNPSGEEGTVPIGRPVANTQIYLLDGHLHPVPVGAAGELCIGGVQVARGYINQPELTAERFVANPFRPGERIYRTGDMARHRSDGAIEFLGRKDHQVKIRGIRVELGEVEAAVASAPHVRQAVAVLRADVEGQQRLVAYVLPEERGHAPNLAEMRALLSQWLPTSMVPSAFATVDSVPMTPGGKVDRAALPDPSWQPLATFHPPNSPMEQRMAALWESTLRVPRVGIDDDFFELGGHSMLAVRLLVKVEREFGVALPLAAFFEGRPTVARLAAAVESGGVAIDRSAQLPGSSADTRPVLFFVQPGESAMLTLRHFTRALGSAQRVVGLLPQRKGARFDQSSSIEDLAAGILGTIRETQASGPYYISGFSMGGLLAYEIARQLTAAGEEVAWLALLDAAPPAFSRQVMRRRLSLSQRLARQRNRGLGGALRHSGFVLDREITAALVRLHLRRSRLGDDFDWRGALKLASRYACIGNDVPMDLFVAADGVAESGSRSLGWDAIHRGPLQIHDVPGGHVSMMTEPHVSVVAEMLRLSLRRAQAGDGAAA